MAVSLTRLPAPAVSLHLSVHAVCRTQGRQGASWEAGRNGKELQEQQTRLFSPGWHVSPADTLCSRPSWLTQPTQLQQPQQHNAAAMKPQGLFQVELAQAHRTKVAQGQASTL